MIDTIDSMIEIADYLNDKDTDINLKRLKQTLEDGAFLLTVIGQFSAGKSRLINNLLGSEVLPVHTTETTAIVTFIKYGDEEQATVIHRDGSCEDVSIEQAKQMWQSGEDANKLENIASIHITFPSDLLKNGLVIADTPGINTIIEKHITETQNIISNSDRILYVMGKPFTESDKDFIRIIEDNGVNVILVRTHMDEVKLNEENAAETIEKERQTLSAFSKEQAFFVSNERNSAFYDSISALKKYLSSEIAEQVATALNKAVAERTLFFSEKQESMLLEKKDSLNIVLNGSYAKYEEQRKEIEENLRLMESLLKENRQRLNDRYQEAVVEAKDNLKQEKERTAQIIKGLISEMNTDSPSECQELVMELLKGNFSSMRDKYCETFDRIVRDNSEELTKQIQQISDNSNLFNEIPDFPLSLENAEVYNEEIIDQMNALTALKNELSNKIDELNQAKSMSDIDIAHVQQETEEVRNALNEIQKQIDNYEPYKERYVFEEGTHDHENTWRTIGNIVDWATILIPGKTWAKIGGKVLKWGTKGAKAVKAIKVADAFADGARAMGKISKHRGRLSEAQKFRKKVKLCEYNYDADSFQQLHDEPKPSVLDYLGLDYWFAKFGKQFDTPDTTRLDIEYEKRYYEEKNRIIKNQQQKADEEYKKRMELLDLKSEQKKLDLQKEILEKKMASAEAQIREEQKELNKQKHQAYIKAFKDYYTKQAVRMIDEYANHIIMNIQPEIDRKMKNYIDLYDFPVSTEIGRKREELEKLEEMFRTSGKEEFEHEIETCNRYLEFVTSFKKGFADGNN